MQRRKKILDPAHELKLPSVVRCVDEVMQAATQNSWRAQQIVAEFFKAELAGKTARLIRDQMGAAKFPLSRSLAEFDFIASPSTKTSCARSMMAISWDRPGMAFVLAEPAPARCIL